MIYEDIDIAIQVRDCCDIIRERVSDKWDWGTVAAPAAQAVGNAMEQAAGELDSKTTQAVWSAYEDILDPETLKQGIQARSDFDRENHDEYLDEIIDDVIEAFREWENS